MKNVKIAIMIMAVVGFALAGLGDASARGGGHGGGGHGGGGYHGEGGWRSGGREGGDFGGREHEFDRHQDHDHDRPHPDHPDRPNYNPNNSRTVNVNAYGNGGWNGYGAADDAIAGMMVGTALGAVAASNSGPSTIVIEQPAQSAPQAPAASMPIGTQTSMLPTGCQGQNVNGTLIYHCGPDWYKPYFGPSGVYYQVVQAPSPLGNAAAGL